MVTIIGLPCSTIWYLLVNDRTDKHACGVADTPVASSSSLSENSPSRSTFVSLALIYIRTRSERSCALVGHNAQLSVRASTHMSYAEDGSYVLGSLRILRSYCFHKRPTCCVCSS